jgi:beta-carotene ketolase (CrtW type)
MKERMFSTYPKVHQATTFQSFYGVMIASMVLCAWLAHLRYSLEYASVGFFSPMMYFHIALQGYLSTGLFITAHDAMHGTVMRSNKGNRIVGTLACFLFAGMSFRRLQKNHWAHHLHPADSDDPDYYPTNNFFVWFAVFMFRYTTISQLIIMACMFNILLLRYNEIQVWIYWALPSLLGALQLFYFGTYRPHRTPHTHEMGKHRARTLKKNHLWALLSCYFFGYHLEHHASPSTPWWQLYRVKNMNDTSHSSIQP